jgi:predicted RNA polymerase sigma factor
MFRAIRSDGRPIGRMTGKREVTPQLPVKIDLPGYQLTYVARAAALGQLGECERAKDQLSQLIALRPDAAESCRALD